MRAEAWQAFGQLLVAIGGLSAALWAVYNYRKNTRIEAARWVKNLHEEFYTEPELLRGRELFEYDYERELRYLFEIRVTDRHVLLNDRLRENLRLADRVLNFFEQIVYLQDERHISENDSKVFFDYWFGIIGNSEKSGLHRYMARCGYERCTKFFRVHNEDYLVFYGTLMSMYDSLKELGAEHMVEFIGQCTFPGKLVDLGEWPGAIRDEGGVEAELWKVIDYQVFRKLDPFERYDPMSPEKSYYERRTVRLIYPENIDAWVYYLRRPNQDAKLIESGNWGLHKEERDAVTATVRRCREEDAAKIHSLVRHLSPLITHTPYTYWVLCNYSPSRCFVAEHNGEIVGFATGILSDSNPASFLVWQIGVQQDFRGTGLSDRLLDRIAESARAAGAISIEATIEEDNSPSRSAFARLAVRLASELQRVEDVAIRQIRARGRRPRFDTAFRSSRSQSSMTDSSATADPVAGCRRHTAQTLRLSSCGKGMSITSASDRRPPWRRRRRHSRLGWQDRRRGCRARR